jgi:hypothetical protein
MGGAVGKDHGAMNYTARNIYLNSQDTYGRYVDTFYVIVTTEGLSHTNVNEWTSRECLGGEARAQEKTAEKCERGPSWSRASTCRVSQKM